MATNPIKGIIFDLDGTLADSLATTFDAFNHGIVAMGGRKHTPHEIMAYFGAGEDRIFAKILGDEVKAMEAYELCRRHTDENLHRMPLHEGVPELLEKLKSAGVPISIVTGRSWLTTELILRHHRLLDRFITVIAHDHVSSPKPSPEGIQLALSRMKLDAAEAFYVGDSHVDMIAARSAGSEGVAALWDLMAKREHLAKWNPHHFADSPSHVWEIFEQSR